MVKRLISDDDWNWFDLHLYYYYYYYSLKGRKEMKSEDKNEENAGNADDAMVDMSE